MSDHSTTLTDVCWALARECRGDDVVIVGVATPLAAAAAFLAKATHAAAMTVIVGGAVDPRDVDVGTLLADPAAAGRLATAMLGQRELLSLLQRGAFSLQFVSPAQVDRTGAINTSLVRGDGEWRRLPGCLALPDTASLVGRLIAYRVDGGDRFRVDRVDHVTGIGTAEELRTARRLPGHGVTAVVTESGRFAVDGTTWGAPEPLERAPAEVAELLSRRIDPHGVLGIETSRERARALRALASIGADR